MAQLNLFALIGSVLLALLATGLQGINYMLMIPVVHVLISGNTQFLENAQYFKMAISWLPLEITSSDKNSIFFLVGAVFSITILKICVRVLFDVSGLRQVQGVTSRLRGLIYERYLSFGKPFFDHFAVGSLQHILLNHPRHIAQGLKSLQQSFYSIAMLVISLILMVKISWKLTLVTVFLWPVSDFFSKGIIQQIRQSSILSARANDNLAKKISNALFCMPMIKACSSEKTEKIRFMEPSELADNAAMTMAWKQFLIGPIQEIAGLSLFFILIVLLAYNYIDNDIRFGAASYVVFFFILRRTTPLLGSFTRFNAAIAGMRGSLDELENIFSEHRKFCVAEGQQEFKDFQKEIRFEHLSFEYANRKQVLKDISFSVKKGGVTALVGPTGAGKTTLIHLLMRFYDCAPNTIFLDGQDLRCFSLRSFHNRVAFISQEPFLFNETICFNLNYGLDTEASADEMAAALRQAKLDDLIKSLPQGLETVIGDRGIRLSGGEKQRLSIARALLRNADILILDEATSALDSQTEQLIQEAIRETVRGKTTVVVAHRLSTIRDADHIVVLDKGQIVQEGPLTKLLGEPGLFGQLWQAQRFY